MGIWSAPAFWGDFGCHSTGSFEKVQGQNDNTIHYSQYQPIALIHAITINTCHIMPPWIWQTNLTIVDKNWQTILTNISSKSSMAQILRPLLTIKAALPGIGIRTGWRSLAGGTSMFDDRIYPICSKCSICIYIYIYICTYGYLSIYLYIYIYIP